jgi:hypothetical protein
MNPTTNSAAIPPKTVTTILFSPAALAASDRMLRSAQALDDQLSNQRKAREAERQVFQQDTFIRSRELEALRTQQQ